ncbi:MAG: methylmalonyl Co-A mutase-associated GTPase MeaB, partial [Planctomycetes bacterium]|nr:methylmalonyl Co-A mutase-associated GTPase MeaB [Planctomycetota bacterium]
LGDKTRMERLARDPHAFVRPSPGGSAHGGVARRTREAALLCEAAGFDVVLIETIGVGQSELAVAGMVDTFVLLLLAGGGDELQGIKRGVMELADIVVLHKADGDAATRAAAAAAEYRRALELLPSATSGWRVPVLTASAHSGAGVAEVFDAVEAHRAARGAEGLTELRRRQAEQWFDDTLHELLLERALRDPAVAAALDGIREQVRLGSIQPTAAALAVLALHGR